MRCGIIHWLSLDKIVLMKGVYKRNEWLSVWPQLTILCSAKCIIITHCVRHQTLFCWSLFRKHCKDMRRLLCILYQSLPKHQVPQIFTFYMQLGIMIFYKYYINFWIRRSTYDNRDILQYIWRCLSTFCYNKWQNDMFQ